MLPALILLAYPSISPCNLQRRRRISGKQLTDKILAFPHDALRQDLEQIIRYHISLGCDDIPDEYDNETEGVDIYAKWEVFPAVVQIGLRHPERREEVIEWFRQVLRFATEDLPEGDAFDSELAGLLVCDIIDLQAVELKPELDTLFETGLVCCGTCGSYASVIRDLSDLRHLGHLEDCILDIHERYEEFREPCKDE